MDGWMTGPTGSGDECQSNGDVEGRKMDRFRRRDELYIELSFLYRFVSLLNGGNDEETFFL